MHFGECCFRVSGPVLQQVHVLIKGDDEGFVVAGSQDFLEKNAGGLLLGLEAGSHRGADVEDDADAQGQRALLLEEMNGGRRLMVVENGEILAGQLVLEVSVGVGNGEAQIDFVNALHDAEFGSVACRRSSHRQRARLILLGDHKAYSAESQQKEKKQPALRDECVPHSHNARPIAMKLNPGEWCEWGYCVPASEWRQSPRGVETEFLQAISCQPAGSCQSHPATSYESGCPEADRLGVRLNTYAP